MFNSKKVKELQEELENYAAANNLWYGEQNAYREALNMAVHSGLITSEQYNAILAIKTAIKNK